MTNQPFPQFDMFPTAPLLCRQMMVLQGALMWGGVKDGKFTGPTDEGRLDELLAEVSVTCQVLREVLNKRRFNDVSGGVNQALASAVQRYYVSTTGPQQSMSDFFVDLVKVCSTHKLAVPDYVFCHKIASKALDVLETSDTRNTMAKYMAKRRTLFRFLCYLKIIHTQQDSIHAVLREEDRRAITNAAGSKGAMTPGALAVHFDKLGSLSLALNAGPSAPQSLAPQSLAPQPLAPRDPSPADDPSLEGFLSLVPDDDD